MNLIVEFFGVPGSGKSTLARAAIEELARRGLPRTTSEDTRIGKAVGVARFCVAQPNYTQRSIRSLLATQQRSRREITWLAMTWFKRSARMAALRGKPGLHIVDVGILQALWSIGFRATIDRTTEMIESLGSALPVADLVVLVQAEPDTIARRLAARPGQQSRLERFGDDGHGRRLVHRIIDASHARCEIADNDAVDVVPTVARIADRIEGLWRSRSS